MRRLAKKNQTGLYEYANIQGTTPTELADILVKWRADDDQFGCDAFDLLNDIEPWLRREPAPLKQGDWVLYQGKPRQVYEFHDNSFAGVVNMIITVDLKNPIKESEVTRLIEVTN